MKKTIVAIFAHPDDEAFGPGGTLALLSQEHDVHIICATRGDAGHNNSTDIRELSQLRTEELENAAAILGVKKVHFLDYNDGCLCNSNYHTLADDIRKILDVLKPTTLITYEPHGVSGHLDHVAVSMVTSFIFQHRPSIQELWYFCLTEEMTTQINAKGSSYFVYMPPGYKQEQIDKTIDISSVIHLKHTAMAAHVSQWREESSFRIVIEHFREENFLIKTKS